MRCRSASKPTAVSVVMSRVQCMKLNLCCCMYAFQANDFQRPNAMIVATEQFKSKSRSAPPRRKQCLENNDQVMQARLHSAFHDFRNLEVVKRWVRSMIEAAKSGVIGCRSPLDSASANRLDLVSIHSSRRSKEKVDCKWWQVTARDGSAGRQGDCFAVS